jgi:exopolysaccharide production protein ExoZ
VSPGPESPGGRWESFDLLRALAASLVFVYHYGGFVAQRSDGDGFTAALAWCAERLGSVGTNLLLLICGLFVAKSVAQVRFRYRGFLERRFARIYPPYLLVVCSAVIFAFLFPRFSKLDPSVSLWRTLPEQLLLWPGLFPNRPVLTVAWTLSWIMATYVMLPLPLRALRSLVRDEGKRVAILGCLVLAWVAIAYGTGRLSPRISYILGGCAVYELFALFPPRRANSAKLRLVLLGGGVALGFRFAIESSASWGPFDFAKDTLFTIFGLVGVTLLTVAAFVLQVRDSLDYYVLPFDPIRRLGRAGYSFYMLHTPVTKVFAFSVFPALGAAGAGAWAYWACLPMCFLLAAGASALLFVTVERRIQRFMSRRQP